MIQKLQPIDYSGARLVHNEMEIHLAVKALLEGSSPGEVYVDDPVNPKSVFAWTMHRFFLAGAFDNNAFNARVKVLFDQTIYPKARQMGRDGFTLYYAPDGWGDVIQKDILFGKYPLQEMRQYYVFKDFKHDWRSMLADGFSTLPVDEELLAKEHLKNLDELIEETQSERPSVEAYLESSFGTCVVHQDELVSWCLSEYNCAERCEVGIETQRDYQKRGLATITASALIEKAHSEGITEIGWHCYAGNKPSSATALKIGFEKVSDYPVFWAMFDEAINMAVNGNSKFEQKAYKEAVEWYQRAINIGEVPAWMYWNTASAYAHLDDKESAFNNLNLAVDKGFRDAEYYQNSPHFERFHGTQEWEHVMDRLKI